MSLADNFQRTYGVWVNDATSGVEVRAWLAAEADSNVAAMIAADDVAPNYRRFVDGVENAPNEAVTINAAGTGSILYAFSNMAEAAGFALDFAISHSPKLSGDYAASWYLLVDGQPYASADLMAIPLGAEVIVSNYRPYHRKIDVGGMRMDVAPQIVEATRQAVMRKFPGISAERKFITIPGGYVLGSGTTGRARAIRSGISYDKKTKAPKGTPLKSRYFQLHPARKTNRSDARKGEEMTYPSLVMNEAI